MIYDDDDSDPKPDFITQIQMELFTPARETALVER